MQLVDSINLKFRGLRRRVALEEFVFFLLDSRANQREALLTVSISRSFHLGALRVLSVSRVFGFHRPHP